MCLRTPYPIESIPDVFEKSPPGFLSFSCPFFCFGVAEKGGLSRYTSCGSPRPRLNEFYCVTPFNTDLTRVISSP